ncbi:MAG TPA: adenylate kinase [Bacillota bacterium]
MSDDPDRRPGRRILVIGTSGSGKTTMAARLSHLLGCRHIELDALYWGPQWTHPPLDDFRRRVTEAIGPDRWVVDGNYSMVRDILWRRADTIVWLDFTLPVIMGRLLRRTLRRVLSREELWNGNRQELFELFTRNSILWWALTTYRRRRREYPELFRRPEYRHLRVIRLRSPRAAASWLREVAAAARATGPRTA